MGAILGTCGGKSRHLPTQQQRIDHPAQFKQSSSTVPSSAVSVKSGTSNNNTNHQQQPLLMTSERSTVIHEGLVRVRDRCDRVQDYYEILDCIGRGSFSKIYKIRKIDSKIGGSSRPDNVKKQAVGEPHSSNPNPCPDTTTTTTAITIPNFSELNHPIPKWKPTNTKSTATTKDLFFVLKEMDLTMISSKQIDQLVNEVHILKTVDHQNIIKIYETFSKHQPEQLLQVVMEHCSGGDLYTRFPYTEHRVALMIRQIVSAVRYVGCLFFGNSLRLMHISHGVAVTFVSKSIMHFISICCHASKHLERTMCSYLHDRSIIHRDLKLENIVFETEHPDSIVKLIDFGVSMVYTQTDIGLSERVGTIYSMAPETMKGDYSSQADLWSLGVCTYMLLANGQKPFDAPIPKQIVHKVLQGEYEMVDPKIWTTISDDAKQFLRSLLVVEPKDRCTATAAKHHPWLLNHYEQYTKLETTAKFDESMKQRVQTAILQYASTSDFVKLAMNVVAKKSTGPEIGKIRTLFDELDMDQTGTLDMSEFKAFFNDHDQYTDEYVEMVFNQIVRSVCWLSLVQTECSCFHH
jgi:calcium-dependent protein kinase